jgi:phosphoesterase RecJ-like protein
MGKNLGKDMAIINKDNTPFPFNHYPDTENIKIGQIAANKFDALILLECANVARSGHQHINDDFIINMDHHYSNDYYADINWVDPQAPAVAVMAYELGRKMNMDFTPQIANHLYCGVVSDTGSFQFSNTNARAFKACYELVTLGASPVRVSEHLFSNNPAEKIKLMGHVLSTLEMNETGDIAIITMFKKHLEDLNLREIDTEDITTLARSIKSVKIVLFFKEISQDTFRVSIRSKGQANGALIAEHFGGGGHRHAAGFTVTGKHKKLIKDIPKVVQDLIKEPEENNRNPSSRQR